jgi:hypothetical protein
VQRWEKEKEEERKRAWERKLSRNGEQGVMVKGVIVEGCVRVGWIAEAVVTSVCQTHAACRGEPHWGGDEAGKWMQQPRKEGRWVFRRGCACHKSKKGSILSGGGGVAQCVCAVQCAFDGWFCCAR